MFWRTELARVEITIPSAHSDHQAHTEANRFNPQKSRRLTAYGTLVLVLYSRSDAVSWNIAGCGEGGGRGGRGGESK